MRYRKACCCFPSRCMTSAQSRRLEHITGLIRERSPFSPDETERIIRKYFHSVPRLVSLLIRHHGFHEKKILDLGSAYGQSLLYWGDDSEAVEIQKLRIFLEALGRTVHAINVEDGFSAMHPESFEGVFSNNLFEHLTAPHLFLRRMYALLKPEGLLAIGHPVVPPFPFDRAWRLLGRDGWTHAEHVNFFTPATARATLERGGFRVLRQYFSLFGSSRFLNALTLPLGVHCLSVCQKIDGYAYDEMRSPRFDPTWAADLRVSSSGATT